MPSHKMPVARQRKILVIAWLSMATMAILGIILYPRLFQNNYPGAVSQAKEMYVDHKHHLHDLRHVFQKIEQDYPGKLLTVWVHINRDMVELRVDSLTAQGERIHQETHYDNWPVEKPAGLRNKMLQAGVAIIRNDGQAICFKLDKTLLHGHHGYIIHSEHADAGVPVDKNWFVAFKEIEY